MNLMNAVGKISDEHIAEFAHVAPKKFYVAPWMKITAAAACLAVCVTAYFRFGNFSPVSSESGSNASLNPGGSVSDSNNVEDKAAMVILNGISYSLDLVYDVYRVVIESSLPDEYVLVGEVLCSGKDDLDKEGFALRFQVGDEIYQNPEFPDEVYVFTSSFGGNGKYRFVRCITNELRMIEYVKRDYNSHNRALYDIMYIDLDLDGEDELLVLAHNRVNARVFEVWEKSGNKFEFACSFGAGKANFIDTLSLKKTEYNGETVFLYTFAYDEGGSMKADEVVSMIRKTDDGYEAEHILSRGTITYSDIQEPFTKEFYRKGWSKYDIGMSGDYGDISKEEYERLYNEIMGKTLSDDNTSSVDEASLGDLPPTNMPFPQVVINGDIYLFDGDSEDSYIDNMPDGYELIGEVTCSGNENIGKEGFGAAFAVGNKIYQHPDKPEQVFVYTTFMTGGERYWYVNCVK